MKKKFKLMLLLVILATVSTIVVLGTWLYGSYKQRIELFVSTTERGLFEAFQETISDFITTDISTSQRIGPHPHLTKKMVAAITQQVPGISEVQIQKILDSLWLQEGRKTTPILKEITESQTIQKELFGKNGEKNQILIPLSFLEDAAMEHGMIERLKKHFNNYLLANSLPTKYDLRIEILSETDVSKVSSIRKNISLRPSLISSERNLFVLVTFPNAWSFMFYALSWQLLISMFILSVVVGTFLYLFFTVFKLNRFSILRTAFMNGLTHELRTPLSIVYMAVEGIRDCGNFEKGKEKQKRYYDMAIEELNNLTAMIDNVLQIAERDNTQKIKLNTSDFNLIELIQESIQYIEQYKPNVLFQFADVQNEVIVYADKTLIRNVLHNLIDNAIKYGSNRVILRVYSKKKNNKIYIDIEDNGMGIPVGYQQQIFESFFRVPYNIDQSVKGFGIGLFYVKQVMAQHGGHVKFKSEEGQGSIFTVIIPKKVKEND